MNLFFELQSILFLNNMLLMPTELYRHIGHKHIFIYVKASTYPLRVIPNAFRDEKLKKKNLDKEPK